MTASGDPVLGVKFPRSTLQYFCGEIYFQHKLPIHPTCVFRRNWTAVPGQTGHAIRCKLDSHRSEATQGLHCEFK